MPVAISRTTHFRVYIRVMTRRLRAGGPSIHEAIEQFETHLRVTRSLPARQVRTYFHYPLLSILPAFCDAERISTVQDLAQDAVNRLVLSLEGRKKRDGSPISPATRVAYWKAIRQFVSWLGGEGIGAADAGQIGIPSLKKKRKNLLTAEEQRRLVDGARHERDKLITKVMLETAAREEGSPTSERRISSSATDGSTLSASPIRPSAAFHPSAQRCTGASATIEPAERVGREQGANTSSSMNGEVGSPRTTSRWGRTGSTAPSRPPPRMPASIRIGSTRTCFARLPSPGFSACRSSIAKASTRVPPTRKLTTCIHPPSPVANWPT
jgi:hypothetical protein